MTEETQAAEPATQQAETATAPIAEPTAQPQPNMVVDAVKAKEGLKEQVDRMEVVVARGEKLFALQQLGGQSEAGRPQEIPKKETAQEYKDRVMKGEFNAKARPEDKS